MVGMRLVCVGAVWVWCRGVVYVVCVCCVCGGVWRAWCWCGDCGGVGVDVGCVGLVRVGVCVRGVCVVCCGLVCVLGLGQTKGTAQGVKPNNSHTF